MEGKRNREKVSEQFSTNTSLFANKLYVTLFYSTRKINWQNYSKEKINLKFENTCT